MSATQFFRQIVRPCSLCLVSSHRRVFAGLAAVLLFFILATPGFAQMAPAEEGCGAAELVPFNIAWRTHRPMPDGSDLLRFDFPSPGMFALHASSTLGDGVPVVSFLGDSCRAGGGFSLIRETPIDLVLRVRVAGPHYLTVSPEDAEVGLWAYKLVTAFAPDPVVPDEAIFLGTNPPESCTAEDLPLLSSTPFVEDRYVELHRDARFTKDVDPIECDVLSGGSESAGVLLIETEETPSGLLTLAKVTAEPIRATLFDGERCATEDRLADARLENGSFLAAPIYGGQIWLDLLKAKHMSYSLGVKYFALCGRTEQDDHLDWPLCSTHLASGTSTHGTLDDGLPDDEDFFTFKLPSLETVKIDVRSEDPVAVALYDGSGQRLALRNTCTSERVAECGAHIVRTLGNDRYFVRVAGAGTSSGAYSVTLGRPDAP